MWVIRQLVLPTRPLVVSQRPRRLNGAVNQMPPIPEETKTAYHAGTAEDPHQVVIIGSGPAGYTAAVYTGRALLKPVLFQGGLIGYIGPGGQLTTTSEVENYPGFTYITGTELVEKMRDQAIHCGAQMIEETVTKVDFSSQPFKLWLEGKEEGEAIHSKTVIIATGATAKRLTFPGSEKYWNSGISGCAVCDGAAPIFRKKPLAVIGGGDSAIEEAQFLSRFGSKVYLIVRRDVFRASKTMQKRAMSHDKIEILWNSQVIEAKGNEKGLLSSVIIEDTKSKTTKEVELNGLFFAIGHEPNTKFLQGSGLDFDDVGYIKVKPGTGSTNLPGIFAAGDVSDPNYRQAITSAGSGCMSAMDAERWLENQESH